MQPLQDWALIEPSEAKEQTARGLFIPDTAKEKPVEGKVLAVGKGRWDTPEKSLAVNPTRKRKRSSSPRSSNLAIRSSTRNTERPRSIWTVRNSFSSASPTSWAGSAVFVLRPAVRRIRFPPSLWPNRECRKRVVFPHPARAVSPTVSALRWRGLRGPGLRHEGV